MDEQIEELFESFQHLVDGLKARLKVLNDENVILKARLDERRWMGEERRQGDQAPLPKPTPLGPKPVCVRTAGPKVKKSYPHRIVRKPCEGCGVEIEATMRRKFCPECFRAATTDRLERMRAAQREQRIQKIREDVDARLAGRSEPV